LILISYRHFSNIIETVYCHYSHVVQRLEWYKRHKLAITGDGTDRSLCSPANHRSLQAYGYTHHIPIQFLISFNSFYFFLTSIFFEIIFILNPVLVFYERLWHIICSYHLHRWTNYINDKQQWFNCLKCKRKRTAL